MRRSALFLLLVGGFLLYTACSLQYEEAVSIDDSVPELTFRTIELSRYRDYNRTIQLSAALLEQYRDTGASYAKDASFVTWTDEQALDTEGSCGLLSLNTKDELYTLFGNIEMRNHTNNVTLLAQNLRWNGKTEQLISGAQDQVTLIKDGLSLTGMGFSASGVTHRFVFEKGVTGSYEETSGGEGQHTKSGGAE